MNDYIERPTLATTLDMLRRYAIEEDHDLIDLVDMAVSDHEPKQSHSTHPRCPTCDALMPCAIWAYAEIESRIWIVAVARTRTGNAHARIDRYEQARNQAA